MRPSLSRIPEFGLCALTPVRASWRGVQASGSAKRSAFIRWRSLLQFIYFLEEEIMGMLLTRRVLHIAVWLGAAVMAGCGGGGGASPPPPTTPPTIATQPAPASVTAGQTATFNVTASGTAPLAYQWRINGAAVAGATASVFTIATTSITNNGARVSVLVSNAAGSASSANAVLTVNAVVPPTLARYVPVWSSNDTTSSTGSYTLSVVDPAAPGTLIAVDQVPTITGNLGTILRLRGGAYDAESGLVSDAGVRNLVYVKGGSLYRVNLDKGSGPPAPVRLSTETLATGQNVQIAAASANGSDALISYLPTSGTTRYVGLSATAGTAPRTAPNFPGDLPTFGLIGWANDPATGAIATLYWQSLRSGGGWRLFRTDASFGNPTSVATFSSNIDTLWLGISAFNGGRMRHGMFFIADSALRRLDFASGNVRVVLGSVSSKLGGGVFDDSHVYLLLQTAAGVQLVRATDDDSSPGQVIASGAALAGFSFISAQTRDYLIFITGATGDTAVSVRKTDGLLTPLPTASPPSGFSASWITAAAAFSGTAGNRVFYHYPGRIGSVAADGSDRREHSGNFMTTALLPASLPVHRLHAREPFELLAARLLVQSASSLIWLDAVSGDLGVTVGRSPGIATFGNEQLPYKDWALGRAGAIGYQVDVLVSPGTTVGRLDAIYLTDQANSLLRLTNFIP